MKRESILQHSSAPTGDVCKLFQQPSMHVNMVKHPKTNQGDGKNWLCAGTLTGKTRFQGAKKVSFIACHSGKL